MDSQVHVFLDVLSLRHLSKNLKMKLYKTIILPVMLYVCEAWSLTLREERRLTVFEKRNLRRIFGPKVVRKGSGESSIMGKVIVCTVHLILSSHPRLGHPSEVPVKILKAVLPSSILAK